MTTISVQDANDQAEFMVDVFWEFEDGSPIGSIGFDVSAGDTMYIDIDNLDANGKLLAKAALAVWSAYTGINFVYGDYTTTPTGTTPTTVNSIIFGDDEAGAFAGPTYWDYGNPTGPNNDRADTTVTSASVNISTSWLTTYGVSVDSYSFQTYLHEIGHALGLGHAGPYDGAATYGVDNIFAFDSWQMTVMSYFDQVENTDAGTVADFAYIISPMMADIVAMQMLYGTAGNLRTGNDTYGGAASLAMFGADMVALLNHSAPTGPMSATIMDDGGIDTFDFSDDTDDQEINLASGGVSTVYGIIGNIIIFFGTVIENVVAGSGNDTVYGNGVANNLNGGLGNDHIYGYGGGDTLISGGGVDNLYGGSGSDTLYGAGGLNYLYGGDNIDFLYAGAGTRTDAYGGEGADRIYGNLVAHRLYGDGGADFIRTGSGVGTLAYGGADGDFIYGGTGKGTLQGDGGNDFIYANATAHTLYGGSGVDRLFGNSSNGAIIYGGSETDYIYAGSNLVDAYGDGGNDYLYGGTGGHSLYGGTGIDRFFANTMSDSSIVGGDDNDLVYLQSASGTYAYGGDGVDRMYGQNSDDSELHGGNQTDFIYGGAATFLLGYGGSGNDFIYAGGGSQTFFGGSGVDRLYGTAGDYDGLSLYGGTETDYIFGGAGDEFLYAGTTGSDNDFLYGGNGNDFLQSNGGNDKLFGGNGFDTLVNGGGVNNMTGGANADFFRFTDANDLTFINDFQNDIDTIQISSALSGGLSVADFLAAYATTANGNTYISVGGTDIRILGFDDLNELLDDISFF
jgi:serralysin